MLRSSRGMKEKVKTIKIIGQIIEADDESEPLRLDECLLTELVKISIENKIFLLFYEKLCEHGYILPNYVQAIAEEQKRQESIYKNILKEISELASSESVDFLVIKTIRPFPYVGSDVDIILHSNEEFKCFTHILVKHGYNIIGGGNNEVTLEKNVNQEIFLVDVHDNISAAGIVYIDKKVLWKNKSKINLDGSDIWVPSPEAELALMAAHTMFKELNIPLSDFFNTMYLINHVDWDDMHVILNKENLEVAFSAFMSAINNIHKLLYGSTIHSPYLNGNFLSNKRIINAVNKDFSRKLTMPYYYSPIIVAASYIDKLKKNPKEIFKLTLSRHAVLSLLNYFKKVV